MEQVIKEIIFVPSCGIGYYFDKTGRRYKILNQLTTTDTEIRCRVGIKLFSQSAGYYGYIFCAGGIFLPPDLQTEPAAELMKQFMVKQGVPEDRILIETKSRDTWENVEEMKKVLLEKGLDIAKVKITIVSHWTHVIRIKMLLKFNGFSKKNIAGKYLNYPVGITYILKELLIIALTIRDKKGSSKTVQKERQSRTF